MTDQPSTQTYEARILTPEELKREELVWLHGLATDPRVLRRIERELFKMVRR